MENEKVVKLKHTKILNILLIFVGIFTATTFYGDVGLDFEFLIQTLQYSSLVLLSFILVFTAFNTHLIGNDNKVKKVFDHLIFFSFLYYISIHAISLLSKINSGIIYDLSDSLQISTTEIIINHVILTILIPSLVMISLIWSVRNVRIITKIEKNKNRQSLFYFAVVLITILGMVYSALNPLYSSF